MKGSPDHDQSHIVLGKSTVIFGICDTIHIVWFGTCNGSGPGVHSELQNMNEVWLT